jgi:hypothetical protein
VIIIMMMIVAVVVAAVVVVLIIKMFSTVGKIIHVLHVDPRENLKILGAKIILNK